MKKYLPVLLLFAICTTHGLAQTEKIVIHFEFNKYAIDSISAMQIDSMLKSVTNNFTIREIELSGHCDHIGNDTYNDTLSFKRVETTKKYLLSKGIHVSTITKAIGFGKRQPLNNNSTDEERWANRRVEIIVQKNEIIARKTDIKKDSIRPPTLAEVISDSATRVGTSIILKNLNFYNTRHYLLPQSYSTLRELLDIMKNNPTLEIEIHGHVCCTPVGQDSYDADTRTYDLSVQRAKMVYEYLIKNGISNSRMSYKSFGGSNKLFPYERTPEEQMLNRRVEIKIVKK